MMYLMYMRKEGRSDAQKRPRPFGLRPRSRHAALPVAGLQSASFAPGALPGEILDSQRSDRRSVNRP